MKNKSDEIQLMDKDGKPVEIPVEGSIGLLALGHIGLLAWRKKRKEVADEASKGK